VNIQVSIRVASPGDNGAVTQVNAVVTATTDNAAPVPDDHTEHADDVGNPAGPSDIGRDITRGTGDGSTNALVPHPTCDPDAGCCTISLLAGVCLDMDSGGISPQDLVRILGAIFENTSDNSAIAPQYQGDAVQYRPINISVSIRISSPGNDGPVVQTNLVHVQASFSVDVGQAVQALPGSLDTTIEVAPADGDVAAPEPVAGEGESGTGALAPGDIEASSDARAIVSAVIHLAHDLSLRVVAEGVETEGQRDILLGLGCDELQGFLFARPMPADMLLAWVEGRKPAGAADFSPSVRDANFSV